jgi:peptidoglycan/LPS O-acetylase OafA/YrhL
MYATKKELVRSTNKLLGLEIIRFVSAFAVLFWHYQHFAYIADKPVNFVKENQPFYFVFKLFYNYGFYGVQIFWCISGFIFFWKYRETISSKLVSSKRFFILRFSRLYPLHFATLLLVAVLQFTYTNINNYSFVYQNNNVSQFILQLFMASNWGVGKVANFLLRIFTSTFWDYGEGFSFNGPIWTISVEVLVYFIFYTLLRFVSKSWVINILMVAIWPMAKLLKHDQSIIECLYYFYIGGLSAIVSRSVSNRRLKIGLTVLAWCFIFVLPVVAWSFRLFEVKYWDDLFVMTVSPVLMFCASHDFRFKPATHKVIEAAGNMTYSSYLIHFPIQLTIVTIFSITKMPMPLYSPMLLGVFVSTTLLASYLIYRYFEAPAQKAIRLRML